MYRKILVPTDDSEGTQRAIDHAVSLAGAFDGQIHAVSVVDDRAGTTRRDRLRVDESAEDDEAVSAARRVERAAREAGVESVGFVEYGSPQETILSYAREEQIDAVVLASHDRDGLDAVLSSSVSDRIVEDAPCPVLLVPA